MQLHSLLILMVCKGIICHLMLYILILSGTDCGAQKLQELIQDGLQR